MVGLLKRSRGWLTSILVLAVFSVLGFYAMILYSKVIRRPSSEQPINEVKDQGPQTWAASIEEEGKLSSEEYVVKVVSGGKVSFDIFEFGGEVIGKGNLLEVIAEANGEKLKLELVVQAVLVGEEENIFDASLDDLALKKGVDLPEGNLILSHADLLRLFPKGSVWRVKYGIKPIEVGDQDEGESTKYTQFMTMLGEEYYDQLVTCTELRNKEECTVPFFPTVLSIWRDF